MNHLWMRLWFLLIVKPIVRLIIGVAVMGREHLRTDRPFIMVANHNSHLDAVVLMDLLPWKTLPRVRPIAAGDYFDKGPIRRFIWRRCMNVLAIRRDKVDRENNPLAAMIETLDRGESLLIFPEGTRGRPEEFSRMQTGVAHLIRKRPETPVIVVYMKNLGYALPRGDLFLVPLFCDVFIGRPRIMRSTRRDEIITEIETEFDRLRRVAERILGGEDAASES